MERDARLQQVRGQKMEKTEEHIFDTIRKRNIKLEMPEGKSNINLNDLEPQIPQIAQHRVHLDERDKLIWPVMILYPETLQTDFIQNFHEDMT